MKNKIVINIFIAYFIILIIVLISQIKTKDITATEPISTDITVEDKIKNSTILLVDSPFYIMNEKQSVIDSDLTITPIIHDSKIYIPIRFIANAYNATVDFSKNTKEVTVRLNNKAIIFYYNQNKITIIDNISEETKEIESNPIFINDRIYIPLKTFTQAFEKEVFYYNNLIIISNIDDIFDPLEDIDLLNNLYTQVKNLPTLGSKEKLIEILNSKNFTSTKDKNDENLEEYNEEYNIESKIININNEEIDLSPFFIKKIDNLEFYLLENTLYIYKEDNLIYNLNIEENYILNDLYVFSENLILVYTDKISSEEEPYFYVAIKNNESSRIEKLSGSFQKILFSNKSLTIISTKETKDSEGNYSTPITNFENNKKSNYSEILCFPELNSNLYTIVTNLSLVDEEYSLKKVFFGAGTNIFYNNKYLYFITEQGDFSFIHAFNIDNNNLEYITRTYIKGNIKNLYFDNDNYLIKINYSYENELYELIFDYNLKSLS